MEIKKYIKIKIILASLTFLFPIFCHAYSNETTHPALTNETVDIFNKYYPKLKLDISERNKLIDGSYEEDEPAYRPLNHFYDPIHNIGLLGVNMTAKSWAQNTTAQAGFSNLAGVGIVKDLFSSKSDYSWDRAIYDYAYGDKERALKALGHTLHLIQDMSVPPHVRNDQHLSYVDDSPYETYTKKFNIDNLENLSSKLILSDKKPIIQNSLNGYFYDLATFTNANFFSKDTIWDANYDIPNISKTSDIYLTNGDKVKIEYIDLSGSSVKLDAIKIFYNKDKNIYIKEYLINDKDNLVLSDYWSILSEKSVLSGAGVIKLFFDDVEREKQTMVLYNKNKSFLVKYYDAVNSLGNSLASDFSSIFANGGGDKEGNLAVVGVSEQVGGDLVTKLTTSEPLALVNSNENSGDNEEDSGFYPEEYLNLMHGDDEQDDEVIYDDDDDAGLPRADALAMTDGDDDLGAEFPSGVIEPKFSFGVGGYAGFGGGGGAPAATNQDNQGSNTSDNNSQNNDSQQPAPQPDNSNQPDNSEVVAPNPPTITSPQNFAQLNTNSSEVAVSNRTTSITFSGTASSTNLVWTDFSNSTTVADENGNWQLTLNNFNQGTTTLNFYTSNIAQTATSTATTVEIFVDSLAPTVSLNIAECENSISSNTCLLPTSATTLSINWSIDEEDQNDLAYYTISKTSSIDNQTITEDTTATSTQIILSGNQTFTFSISATDTLGNISEPTTQTITLNNLPVVINEIAWAGTKADGDDEWIELYNNTNEDIDLTGWKLSAQDGEPNITLTKTIKAKSYYLLERTDDNTISNITADQFYKGDLNNSGEKLILSYLQNSIDQVNGLVLPAWGGWGSNNQNVSMERIDPTQPNGTGLDNWRTNLYNDITNGMDVGNENGTKNKIFGTPKAKNSVSYLVSPDGIISKNTTLTKENSPYLINSDLTVNEGVALTLEEGTIIKFTKNFSNQPTSLKVNGTIIANGTETNPVVFTSLYDDYDYDGEGDYTGDTNGDGICGVDSEAQCPQAGDWRRIEINSTSQNSSFDHTIFNYGGAYSSEIIRGMILVQNTNATFNNSIFENSKSAGLYLSYSTSGTAVENNTFLNNKDYTFANSNYGYGLNILNGTARVSNNTFENNKRGLLIDGDSSVSVVSNIFNNNEDFAIHSNLKLNTFSDNSGSNNGENAITLSGALTQENSDSFLNKNQLSYLLSTTNGSNDVVANSNLTVDAGVVVKFDQTSNLNVYGNIILNGEENNRILFTSINDDSDGVDVRNNGAPETISPTSGGVNLKSGSTSQIRYTDFTYLNTALNYTDSPVDLQNVRFKGNVTPIVVDGEAVGETLFGSDNDFLSIVDWSSLFDVSTSTEES